MIARVKTEARGVWTRNRFFYATVLLALLATTALACGVKAGENRPARPQGQAEEFHRSPVAAFEQVRIELALTDEVCTSDPADLDFQLTQRVRLAIQLPAEIVEGTTRSLEIVGEAAEVHYTIDGLEISASGGAFSTGVKEVDLAITAGSRTSYDFNTANVGVFDIVCDGAKVGTFTVTE